MKKVIIIMTLVLGTFHVLAQITNVEEKFRLPKALKESSGAIFFNGKLISHNDSSHRNKLYEVDTITGKVTRTITVTNARNVDWEAMAHDESFIYIGDIGNNSGVRTDLKIYKVAKSEYLDSTEVTAEIINFRYSDQTGFASNFNNTKWDAEALISYDENMLILFTKNWVNGVTKAYPIPKSIGTYTVSPLPTTLASEGMITGATYNPYTEKVYLIGYTPLLRPFVWTSENFLNMDIFSGTNTKTTLPSLGFEQIEAITYVVANRYFITSEAIRFPLISDYAKLVSLITNDNVIPIKNEKTVKNYVYPDPDKQVLYLRLPDFKSVEIYDATSKLVFRGYHQTVDVSDFDHGFYFLKVYRKNNTHVFKKMIKN